MTPTIQQINAQLGSGLSGARAYVGCRKATYRDDDDGRNGASSVDENGVIHYGLGLKLFVNGKKGQNWQIVICLESNDLYTVRLWCSARPTQKLPQRQGIVLYEETGIWDDMLQRTVEEMYDRGLKEYNGGCFDI